MALVDSPGLVITYACVLLPSEGDFLLSNLQQKDKIFRNNVTYILFFTALRMLKPYGMWKISL